MKNQYEVALENFFYGVARDDDPEYEKDYPRAGELPIKFNGKTIMAIVRSTYREKELSDVDKRKILILAKKVTNANYLDNPVLWTYLYKIFHPANLKVDRYSPDTRKYEEYYLESPEEFKNTVTEIDEIFVDLLHKVVYVCGKYDVDEEHGFSITFPNGKFVPGKKERINPLVLIHNI